jgi:hypothetical protein
LIALAAPPRLWSPTSGSLLAHHQLAGFCGLVGIYGAEFAVDVGEFTFQFVPLVENLLPLSVQPLTLPGNKVGASRLSHRALSIRWREL